jgi:hypothetical protein
MDPPGRVLGETNRAAITESIPDATGDSHPTTEPPGDPYAGTLPDICPDCYANCWADDHTWRKQPHPKAWDILSD